MPLAISNVAGTIHVYLQKLFNAMPTIFEPVMLPILPDIIDIETAIALQICKLNKKISEPNKNEITVMKLEIAQQLMNLRRTY